MGRKVFDVLAFLPTLGLSPLISKAYYKINKQCVYRYINNAFKNVADQGRFKNILSYVEAPIVSADIIGNSYSSVFDGLCTMAYGKLVKVVSWYDNEWGYSSRLVDLVKFCMK